MKKTKKLTKRGKKPTDATLRNVRASKKRDDSLEDKLRIIKHDIRVLQQHICKLWLAIK